MKVLYLKSVQNFLAECDDHLYNRCLKTIDLLEIHGNNLRLPFSKSLGEGLFVLRTLGNNQVRIFYCFHNNSAYLLHAIVKKQYSIPFKDIARARKYMNGIA